MQYRVKYFSNHQLNISSQNYLLTKGFQYLYCWWPATQILGTFGDKVVLAFRIILLHTKAVSPTWKFLFTWFHFFRACSVAWTFFLHLSQTHHEDVEHVFIVLGNIGLPEKFLVVAPPHMLVFIVSSCSVLNGT